MSELQQSDFVPAARQSSLSNGEFAGIESVQPPNGWIELVRPKYPALRIVSPEVPQEIADDYQEAHKVLQISPKASAALSRRCLERVLHDAGGAKSDVLTEAIDEVLSQGHLPSTLGKELQAN